MGGETGADGGVANPHVLVGDSLIALDEYILVEVPHRWERDGSRQYNPPEAMYFAEDRVTLSVRRRGDAEERDFTLVVAPDMFAPMAKFFASLAPPEQPEDPSV
ncbi:Uncharacterised protein [Mycolicibacterium aurum]|uniref:Uncharacterized protein n=1 Tax=Mycolicibacterium aurum TaxID=1791 RepID=A0A448J0R9_MYCAU|nr:Uncharacterised protein [Mycolicibacterium aurum]